jgi:hypothetical protein
MRHLLTCWICLVGALANAAPEFVPQEVQVGKSKFTLPVPKELRWVSREMPWARAYFDQKEHQAKDPAMNFTFVVVMVSPAHYAQAIRDGRLEDPLVCTACVPTAKLESRHSLKQFRTLTDGLAVEITPVAKLAEQSNDQNIRKVIEGLSEEAILGRTDRTLQTLIADGGHLIASAYVLVEGKVLILNLRRPRQEARDLMAEMEAWVAEISKKTKA